MGLVLVQNRLKKDWPSINFPGGKVEDNETIEEGCIREIKEETNLDIANLINCGYYEWNNTNSEYRHLCILFKTSTFKGEIKSSKEGEIFFMNPSDFYKCKLADGFIEVYKKIIRYKD